MMGIRWDDGIDEIGDGLDWFVGHYDECSYGMQAIRMQCCRGGSCFVIRSGFGLGCLNQTKPAQSKR